MAKTRRNSRRNRRMHGGQEMTRGMKGMNMEASGDSGAGGAGGVPMPAPEVPGPSAQTGGKMSMVGSRAEVMHGSAHHTSGGLTRKDLKYNKHGRIVSRKASERGKKSLKHLIKAGYKAKKGTFRLFKKTRRN